ncbi:MAG TPA: hypothetical protein VJ843_02915 [Candidatus Saccharimonadales bacterium]|nr:hypothetical protein [Candidatus Saccharimonadales bacterium]
MKRTLSTATLVALLVLTIFALHKVQAQGTQPDKNQPITTVKQ